MTNKYKPTIVVVAFDREKSFQRITKSLSNSVCPKDTRLIISIDNNGSNQNIEKLANEFNWQYGEKEVIYHKERLGLRNHIIKCGDLTNKYGSIIILEDDLFVSPHFYSFALQALSYYDNDDKIAGVSLYNQPYTESTKLPFIPINDNSDIYFVKVASSYGQAWTKKQWNSFKKWYDTKPDISELYGLPVLIKQWPVTSWKKYFCAYLVQFDKYFVYPQFSLTTNFNDPGTHFVMKSYFGQAPLSLADKQFDFKSLTDSINVYDAFSEILPDRLNQLNDLLISYDYEVDLYGKKDELNKDYILTSKPCREFIYGFERALKPHELNVAFNLKGIELRFAKRSDVLFYPKNANELKYNKSIQDYISEYSYFYTNVFDTQILIRLLKHRIKKKLNSYFKKTD